MNKFLKPLVVLILATTIFSCKDKEIALPDNVANFPAAEQGIAATANEVEVKVNLSRAVTEASTVTLELVGTGVTYGTHFTTTPAAVNNTVTLSFPVGASSATLKVTKVANIVLLGTEKIQFTEKSATGGLLLGTTQKLTLSFSEIISDGSTLTLEGKTTESNYTNVAYADLSANKTTPVNRKNWALGFYSGADFRVVLNQSFQELAAVVNKTDINAVTLDDAKATLVYGLNLQTSYTGGNLLVDSYDGSFTRTAIATVSATDADNKVHILGLNGSFIEPNLYKIRVLRNGTTGYTLQYAKVQETTFKTVNISKNADYNLAFVSLGNNNDGVIVDAEPKKTEWDLNWSYSTYGLSATNPDANPYFYQDFVSTNNLGGVTAVQISTSLKTYDAYAEADIAGTTFLSGRDVIGSSWRSTSTGIYSDRFYVIKDAKGNVYKLKFVSMGLGTDGGERGKPVIEYKLIKKG